MHTRRISAAKRATCLSPNEFAALEVIDSRYENFQFTLPDVVADQASAALVVLGGKARSPQDLDLRLLGARVRVLACSVGTVGFSTKVRNVFVIDSP